MSLKVTLHHHSDLGIALGRLRAARGWTQTRMSAETGYSLGYICNVESGKANPSAAYIAAALSALEQPLVISAVPDLVKPNRAGERPGI